MIGVPINACKEMTQDRSGKMNPRSEEDAMKNLYLNTVERR